MVYIGHQLTHKGVKPDPQKIEAIVNMPQPEDKNGIQRLLGMVNYVGKFVPNLPEITSPLRQILKKRHSVALDRETFSCFRRDKDLTLKSTAWHLSIL